MIVPHRSNNFYLTGTILFVIAIFLIARQSSSGDSNQPSLFTSLASKKSSHHPRWLLAIMLPPQKVLRRQSIRSTWASRFQNPDWECTFVIGGYEDNPWKPLIDWEIETFGDITVMEDFVPDNADTANHKKAVHLYDRLSQQAKAGGPRYDYVSKVDDDNWLSIPPHYKTFIEPRLPGGPKYKPNIWTVIGRPFNWNKPYSYTSGRMYTVSWAVLEFLGAKYAKDKDFDFEAHGLAEDMVPEHWLWEDKIEHEFVPMEIEQAWDIGLEGTIDNDTILIHCIKTDERLVKMNTLFDDEGMWNGKLENGLTNVNRSMPEVIDRLGEPTEEELEKLREGWKKWDQTKPAWGSNGDPRDTLDYVMIRDVINIENRRHMGEIYPMNLPGNNESTTINPPRPLGKPTTTEDW